MNVLKPETEVMFKKIIDVLIKNKKGTDPLTVIGACVETVIKLIKSKDLSKIKILLEIILFYGDYIEDSESLLEMCERLVKDFSSSIFKIVENIIIRNNGINANKKYIMDFLIKNIHYRDSANILKRNFDILTLFNNSDSKMQLNLLKRCFDYFIGKIDVLSYIEQNNIEDKELLLLYLKNIKEISQTDLKRIIELIPSGDRSNYELLIYIYSVNTKNTAKKIININCNQIFNISNTENSEYNINNRDSDKEFLSIISNKLINMTCNEILEIKHTEEEIEDLIVSISNLLIPHFISLIKSINKLFLSEGKFTNILKNIIGYLKFEDFIEVISDIDIKKHFLIFKFASNVDISTFLSLYSQCYDSESREKLLQCLPAFCNYASDYENQIGALIEIIKDLFVSHRSLAASSLEKLIYSHKVNLSGNTVLKNPITKEESLNILYAIKNSPLFSIVLEEFSSSDNNDCDNVFSLITDLMNIDLSEEFSAIILSGNSNKLHKALKTMPFFIHKWKYNYDLIAELLKLCGSIDSNIYKKSYNLLNFIYEKTTLPVCICDMLFTSSTDENHVFSTKNRLNLLNTIYIKGCKDCRMDSFADKFFREVILCCKYGNIKCRKIAEDILLYHKVHSRDLIASIIDPEQVDIKLLNSAIRAGSVIIKQSLNSDDLEDREFSHELLSKVFSVSYCSGEIVSEILAFFNIIIESGEFIDHIDQIEKIICDYTKNFQNKYFKDIRSTVYSLKKSNCEVPKILQGFLKFRAPSSNKEIQIIKNKE